MTDQDAPKTGQAQGFLTEKERVSIISLVTSVLAILTAIPALAKYQPFFTAIANNLPGVLVGLSAVGSAALIVYKAWPASKASILKGAAQEAGVHAIIADPGVADIGPLADNPKVVSGVSPLSPVVKANAPLVSASS